MPTITADTLRAARAPHRDAEQRLRALLDAAVDAIITIDQHGIIESVNPATQRMFGWRAEELLGCNVHMLMPSPYREAHDGYVQRYLMTGEARIIGIGREVEAQRKDGSVFPADLAISEFEIDGERMFTGLIRDITDRREAERSAQRRLEELAHAGRLADLGMATSTIAHEVNQPLAAIVSFAHACQRILDSDNPDPAVLRDALGQIAAQGERASAIVNRIRGMAKKRDSASEPVDLNQCAENVLSLLSRQLREAGVKVETRLAATLNPVTADTVQVEQIIMNLIVNAIDAMRTGSCATRQLSLLSGFKDDLVTLSIGDTGPGLSDADLERVFDSFYSTKPNGMGVGLSICRSLAQTHGGRLWVESLPGEGAVFHLAFPASSPQTSAQTGQGAPSTSS